MIPVLRVIVIIAFLTAGGVFAPRIWSDVTQDELTTYEKRLEKERKALAALEAAKDSTRADLSVITRQLIAASQEDIRREEKAAKIERRLLDLKVRESAARETLMADRNGMKEIITALIATSRKKPPALIAHPDKATNAIQSAIVMRDVADQLKLRSASLSVKIAEYADLIDKVQKEKTELTAAEKKLAEKREEIQKLAAVKRASFEDLSGETGKLKKTIEALAAKTDNLRTLLADIAANAPKPPTRKPDVFRPSKNSDSESPIAVAVLSKLGLPAVGSIVQKFGDRLPSGRKAEGIKVRTRAAAQVVAPADSTIVWSGPFRSYGKMLILRTGDGYHIVLSGLEDIYGALGQSVHAGEPVGQMSGNTDTPSELYMELRKNGTPEDPAKWMSRKG